MLRLVATWTFLPLINTVNEIVVKHLLLILDWFLTYDIFLKISSKGLGFYQWMLVYVLALVMIVIQGANFYIEFGLEGHEGWMSRYYDCLPSVASAFY